MIALGNYILSIVGIVILGVIIDIMLVEGQMQKYIKSIFVIFVIFVIIAPIPNLMKTDFSVPTLSTGQVTLDGELIKTINNQKKLELENDIIKTFSQNGVSGVVVKVEIDEENQSFVPKKISLNIKKLVIKNNYLNINKYEVLTGLVLEVIQVEKDIIKFYEWKYPSKTKFAKQINFF